VKSTQSSYNLAAAICSHARAYIGFPYISNPLSGSHETAEVFTNRRDGFDCVTFVETVLAECFSEARSTAFDDELRALRYRDGSVRWLARLHYFSDWLRSNEARGVLRAVFPEQPEVLRTLSLLEQYPAQTAELRFLPISQIAPERGRLQSGDIVAFGTTRENLDLAHTGFLEVMPDGSAVLLHATKTFGKVVSEPLETFLERFGASPGILVYRPTLSGN
jgi:hypothetical protein